MQIRLSDGNVVFTPGLFGPGIIVSDVRYQMSLDAGFKYRGFSLEGEYYWRWLDEFQGPGTEALPFDQLRDDGFLVQASAMVVPRHLQLYAAGSKVYGDYGDPWDFAAGVNWFPWTNQVIRCNAEWIKVDRSPVGALSLPYPVGGTGHIYHLNLMVRFYQIFA